MSASLLYHTHGVNGVKYKSTEFIHGLMIIKAELDQVDEKCPKCKNSNLHYRGK